MPSLKITFIDAGWGDSLFLEAIDDGGVHSFGLIDSNDTSNYPSSSIFLKRFFERHSTTRLLKSYPYPLLDFVIASHAHTDHISGLQDIVRTYGTKTFYCSRFNSSKSAGMANLIRWLNKSTRLRIKVAGAVTYLDNTCRILFGPASITVLWPPPPPLGSPNNPQDPNNENNNSLVLDFQLVDHHLVTTGDCEADNWKQVSGRWQINLPASHLKLVQIPHHGAKNGLFDSANVNHLFDQIADKHRIQPSVSPLVALSCHPHPHGHPHPDVISELDRLPLSGSPFPSCVPSVHSLRTDQNLHITVVSDGTTVEILSRPAS